MAAAQNAGERWRTLQNVSESISAECSEKEHRDLGVVWVLSHNSNELDCAKQVTQNGRHWAVRLRETKRQGDKGDGDGVR